MDSVIREKGIRDKSFKLAKNKQVRITEGELRKFNKTEYETIKKIFDILINEAPQ